MAVVEEALLSLAEPLNARIAYDENVTARVTSPITGRVVKLFASQGDEVSASGPLVTLDSPDLAAAVADLDKAVSDEARKKAAFERTEKLLESDVLPRKDFENARTRGRSTTRLVRRRSGPRYGSAISCRARTSAGRTTRSARRSRA